MICKNGRRLLSGAFLGFVFSSVPSPAQAPAPRVQPYELPLDPAPGAKPLAGGSEVKNLQVGQSGDFAVATYDLAGDGASEVVVTVTINGQVRKASSLHLSGDFGKAVKPGAGKTITWDVQRDLPADFDFEHGDFSWQVAVPSKAKARPAGTVDHVNLGNKLDLEMVMIPSGTFQMGYGGKGFFPDEGPIHEVTISRSFWMGKYAVTNGQWRSVMGKPPMGQDGRGFNEGPDFPVTNVNFEDCQQFISVLNSRGIGTYRLPTEAEWEYACRAGNPEETYGNLDDIAWYDGNNIVWVGNIGYTIHPVGQKSPNGFGLYDMLGNVCQWCQDWCSDYYAISRSVDPRGLSSGAMRVCRGGDWLFTAESVRASFRGRQYPNDRSPKLGFRVVRVEP